MNGSASSSLAAALGSAERILFFTGAGISTRSGIPDYRGPTGVWKTDQPVMYQDFMTSHEARVRYWEQKERSQADIGPAAPNAVHQALVDVEHAERLEAVVTQNIDGLHAAAGTSSDKLVELHGTVRWVECQSCAERTVPDEHFSHFAATREPPICHCGGYLKPATISFGQQLRSVDLERAEAAAASTDLVVALGSTLSVTPAATVPLIAAQRGVPYVIVNQGATDHDHLAVVTLRLDGDVTEIVPPAVAAALGRSDPLG